MPSKRAPKAAPADKQPKPAPPPFHESYSHLLVCLPDSVVEKVKARAEARGLDVAVADDYIVVEILEGAREAYTRKKEGSRASAARRRAAKKAAAAPEVEPEAAPAEAPAEALEAPADAAPEAAAPATESTPLP